MAVLEEVVLYAFQQCVYYVSKVPRHVCLGPERRPRPWPLRPPGPSGPPAPPSVPPPSVLHPPMPGPWPLQPPNPWPQPLQPPWPCPLSPDPQAPRPHPLFLRPGRAVPSLAVPPVA